MALVTVTKWQQKQLFRIGYLILTALFTYGAVVFFGSEKPAEAVVGGLSAAFALALWYPIFCSVNDRFGIIGRA